MISRSSGLPGVKVPTVWVVMPDGWSAGPGYGCTNPSGSRISTGTPSITTSGMPAPSTLANSFEFFAAVTEQPKLEVRHRAQHDREAVGIAGQGVVDRDVGLERGVAVERADADVPDLERGIERRQPRLDLHLALPTSMPIVSCRDSTGHRAVKSPKSSNNVVGRALTAQASRKWFEVCGRVGDAVEDRRVVHPDNRREQRLQHQGNDGVAAVEGSECKGLRDGVLGCEAIAVDRQAVEQAAAATGSSSRGAAIG